MQNLLHDGVNISSWGISSYGDTCNLTLYK